MHREMTPIERAARDWVFETPLCPFQEPFKLFRWASVLNPQEWYMTLTRDLANPECCRKETALEEAVALYALAQKSGRIKMAQPQKNVKPGAVASTGTSRMPPIPVEIFIDTSKACNGVLHVFSGQRLNARIIQVTRWTTREQPVGESMIVYDRDGWEFKDDAKIIADIQRRHREEIATLEDRIESIKKWDPAKMLAKLEMYRPKPQPELFPTQAAAPAHSKTSPVAEKKVEPVKPPDAKEEVCEF